MRVTVQVHWVFVAPRFDRVMAQSKATVFSEFYVAQFRANLLNMGKDFLVTFVIVIARNQNFDSVQLAYTIVVVKRHVSEAINNVIASDDFVPVIH